MTSSTTGDRRWGTARRSGMTILGKVAVPKPINLPSQRLENQGLDPNVEIVPKGTLSWGSKSSVNAWGTSSLSPRTESGPGSPSHLSNRPSSGGSVTRPSTADSDKAHDSSSVGWDSNSRPSSASGVLPSNQASVALQRPHSADTRPGSSQLSRFAEAVPETFATRGQHGVAPAKKDGFSLTSGDFPSLGTEKESSERSAMPQDAGPGTRPASSSGRSAEERGVDCTEEVNARIGDDSAWRRDNQPYSEDAPRYCREEGQLDPRGSHSYPNAHFPHQYDAWRGPPVNNHPGGGWYRGNQPYGAPMGPGGFHVDPFPFYPTQVPPVPGHEAGPRGSHAINEKMFRPPMLDPYVHPRPGFYLGPVPREGYYGPPMGYGGPGNRDLPFAGRPAGPHAYHHHSGQGRYDTSASSVALERNEPPHSQERQYKILLKPQDERLKEDEAKREEFLGNRPRTAEKVAPQMQNSKNNRRVNNNEASGEVQPIKAENAAREDPSLIQKIEGLNAKSAFTSGTPANKVSARMPRSHETDSKNSLRSKQGDPPTNKNAELAAISGISVEPNDNQRTTMRELARERAQQRQKEEEERARDQRAKALAKLEELNRRSQLAEEGSVKNLEAAHSASTPTSREKKTTLTAADSIEATEDPGKTLLQDAMPSTDYANNEGPTQHDNLQRHRDGAASKQKRLGYKQKQNIVFEKKLTESSFSEATTEVVDVVPPPEVSNEGVLGLNSDMPAASSVSTELTYTKSKNNRNGKKKHRVEETTAMNPTSAAVGKVSKFGDESIETGRERAAEIEFGSFSVPSLDVKVSGNSSDQISSFTNEESQSRVKNNWKSQQLRRNPRNSVVNKPAEKFPGSSTVIWAPVHPQQKADISTGVGSQNTVPEFSTSSKSLHQGQTSSKSKRVEMERYVAKPIVKEMAEQTVSKNPITAASEMKENCGGEGTGILQHSGSTAGKSGSPSKSRHGNGRQGKHGRDHGPWNQRGSVASTKGLEDGQFRGTVNNHRSNQTDQVAVGSSKDHTTGNADGWNDGWYMPSETHYSAAKEVEANGPGTVAVGKDQGMSIHGKQHASRSNKDGGSNYNDPKKANKRDSSKAHVHQSGHGIGQQDLPVASKESRGPEDHVSHRAATPNVGRGGNHGGREYTRDKTYASQKRDVAGYGHQRFASEQKMASADTPAQSQNRSTSTEVQGEHNPNSMFRKNTNHHSQRFGRGHHDTQGGWGSSPQENMHHHNQRPHSNRDRQRQNLHYEYKPVGSHAHDGEQQFKDGSQTEGPPRYREKGQGQQRHGGQKMYQQERGSAGRNSFHGLTDESN
ncbi:unnamed protein product [Eruca vesicaria subsp. sativa]|uniref:BAT2 N-terminal domain-containing protein n=1 Tax=Eruca vesicaria subsp. sativa TaxID=29727 RepID=A0ABC8MAJ1_ERUVS|nr:unnamed protein product [Eruca vesicaria subsp. sativa]